MTLDVAVKFRKKYSTSSPIFNPCSKNSGRPIYTLIFNMISFFIGKNFPYKAEVNAPSPLGFFLK